MNHKPSRADSEARARSRQRRARHKYLRLITSVDTHIDAQKREFAQNASYIARAEEIEENYTNIEN